MRFVHAYQLWAVVGSLLCGGGKLGSRDVARIFHWRGTALHQKKILGFLSNALAIAEEEWLRLEILREKLEGEKN